MRKVPFKDLLIGTESEMITNPFSGEGCMLPPEAVAMYDYAKGCEMLGDYKRLRICLDWFRKEFPEEYMVLLD
jgi:hypothetical protein